MEKKKYLYCDFCKEKTLLTYHNQKYCKPPKTCKDDSEIAAKKKIRNELRRRIQMVIDGKLSVSCIHANNCMDKKLIRSEFKKAGFIW